MRAIITADWHIRASRPRCRIDEDWMETQKKALWQIIEIVREKNCPVFCVGDLFDKNSDTSFECINLVEEFTRFLTDEFGVLAGNHDLPYHSSENLNKSAIGVLLRCEHVKTIKSIFENTFGIYVSANNFDEVTENKPIVFKHVLCFPTLKDLPPNVEARTAQDLLDEYDKAEWIFTGDYHHHFHYEKDGRHVVNPGCLLRQASDMKDYQCGVYFVDTDENIVEFIPIIDSEDLIDDSYILKENEREERIQKFADKLKTTQSVSLDFLANVENELLNNNLDEKLKETIKELMEV